VENEVPGGEGLRRTNISPLKNDSTGTDSQFPASDGRKNGENSPRARHGGGRRDVKIGSDLGLECFRAQPKWEIPARLLTHEIGESVTMITKGHWNKRLVIGFVTATAVFLANRVFSQEKGGSGKNEAQGSALRPATDEEAAAIKACYAAYEQAVLDQDGEAVIEHIATPSIEYSENLRKLILTADKKTVQSLSIFQKLSVLRCRLQMSAAELQQMSGKDFFAHGIEKGWTDKDSVAQNDLGKISVTGTTAKAFHVYLDQPTPFQWTFRKEDGKWKFDPYAATFIEFALEKVVKQSGQSENEYLITLVELITEEKVDESIWQPMLKLYARTWTDRKGREVQADFVSVTEGKVKIRRTADGKLFDVPLADLSDADRRVVELLSTSTEHER